MQRGTGVLPCVLGPVQKPSSIFPLGIFPVVIIIAAQKQDKCLMAFSEQKLVWGFSCPERLGLRRRIKGALCSC